MDGRSDEPRISASERDPARRDQPGTQGRPLVVEYRCSNLLRDNDLGQPVGSHGGRRHASIGGCLNSAFLYLNETAPRDQLRPQLSGLWIPNLARGIDSGPRQFTNTKRWIGAPDFTSEWAGTGLTSLIAGSYCLLCHRIMGVEHDWESSEYLVRHSRRKRPGDSWPLPAAVCLVSLTRPGIDGGSGRISGRRIG